MNAPSLHIRLFGLLEITWGDRPLPTPRSAKTRSLLAYLIVHRDRAFAREVLAGTFWPDRPDDLTRRALSNALWQIRQSLGPAAGRLCTEDNAVALNLRPADWLDVAAFENTIRHHTQETDTDLSARLAALDQAVDLYRGDLMEECYDDWALVERERLRELYLNALQQLLNLHKQRENYTGALAYAKRLVAADSLREEIHRELMRLYHLLGRDRAAIQQYTTLQYLLKEELGVEPTAATTALYQEIVATLTTPGSIHLPSAPPPPTLHDLNQPPLIGRDVERNRLLEALGVAVQGHGGVALVEGEAGVGKTRLIEEIAASVRWRGLQVALGRATPDVNAPYQSIIEALSPLLTPLRISQIAALIEPHWLSALLPLLPAIADHCPDLPQRRAWGAERAQEKLREGLSRCLDGLASVVPLLLILEDLHWADGATLAALRHLAPRLRQSQLLILATCRSFESRERAEVWETLDILDRSLPLQRMLLSPFDPDQTLELVGRVLRIQKEQAHPLAQQLWAETQGNALFITESLKTLLARDTPDQSKQLANASSPTHSFEQAIQERLVQLEPATRQTLEVITVLGTEADFALIARASNATGQVQVLIDQLQTLCFKGFLNETPTGYQATHNLVRKAVYHSIPLSERQELHRRVGAALAQLYPEQVEALAYHFQQASVSDKALYYTLQAGERAQALYDSQTALAHYQRALTWIKDDPAARWDILARQEKVLGVLGHSEAQANLLEEMLVLAGSLDKKTLARTYYRQGRREVLAGKPDQAISLLEQAIQLLENTPNHALLTDCLAAQARAYWRMGDLERCQTATEQTHVLAQATGDHYSQLQALNMLGNLHLGLTDDYGQALVYFERGKRLARKIDDRHSEASAQGNVGITCSLLGQYERSQIELSAALKFIEHVGDRLWQGIIRACQGANYRGLAAPAQAQAVLQEALAICREINNHNFEIHALELLGRVALDQNDPIQAHHFFEQAAQIAQTNQQKGDWVIQISFLALTELFIKRPDQALQLSGQALTTLEEIGNSLKQQKRVHFARYQIVATTCGATEALPHLEQAFCALQEMAAKIKNPEMRRSFLENIAENRTIVATYQLGHLPTPRRQQVVRLARADAPSGRPLRDDEQVEITWTVTDPKDDAVKGKRARRQKQLLRLLRQAAEQSATPTVADLATALDVTPRTIKRDLAALRAAGHDARTRGSR